MNVFRSIGNFLNPPPSAEELEHRAFPVSSRVEFASDKRRPHEQICKSIDQLLENGERFDTLVREEAELAEQSKRFMQKDDEINSSFSFKACVPVLGYFAKNDSKISALVRNILSALIVVLVSAQLVMPIVNVGAAFFGILALKNGYDIYLE